MKTHVFTMLLAGHFAVCQAQTYSNSFETASDLNDFVVHSPLPGWSVGTYYRPVMTGQSAYLFSGDPAPGVTSTPTTFTLDPGVGFTANFQNTGDILKMGLWHIGTGSEAAGNDFFQFLGIVPGVDDYLGQGALLSVYGDHSDYALGPGGELGLLTNDRSALVTGPFGDSGAPSWDDESWNFFGVKFEYDAAADELILSGGILNYGPTGDSAPVQIATMPETRVSAVGFSGRNVLPAFGMTYSNGKEAYDGFFAEFSPVPEPSSLMLGMAAGIPWVLRRRRAGETTRADGNSH